ncbi:hypothetical protein JANAI62_07920 [Jannaschia pagri]|uniref:Uncharacterized protein n=1 Tax=Jannaschia pagri TaxID=2829797 RepID=A0ABQ4NIY2_9RHOB|nr:MULTISPECIES: hypothetical protein [unclassified Jannaschia]GIT89723.1 hypothetical protein JANAI61_01810 [Jannaschia sp. AI_61]GIT94169.1 hypothetical protein JANAI62_07920 [Jannaschia sp. AI_62]
MAETPGIGHNSGRDYTGYTARLHQWRRARRDLIKGAVPVEVVRLRVRRAAALGLDYGTYASIRAGTGRDIAALLFSSNALRMIRTAEIEQSRAAKVAEVAAARGVLVHAPLPVEAPPPLEWASRAPQFTDRWPELRASLSEALRAGGVPADAVVLVGDTSFEASWCPAMRAGGYVTADAYFGGQS